MNILWLVGHGDITDALGLSRRIDTDHGLDAVSGPVGCTSAIVTGTLLVHSLLTEVLSSITVRTVTWNYHWSY